MTFHNPLHRFSLHDGARTLTLAMGDWAILVVDSSGRVLPLWILNHIHDDIIATHQFTPQNNSGRNESRHICQKDVHIVSWSHVSIHLSRIQDSYR